jgi:putative membrane protein
MIGLFIRWLILTAAIMIASYLLDGIRVDNFFSAFWAAAVLGILNALFRPILILFTLPINILSLGLFTFIINALMLKMASGVISGFHVQGFWTAVFGSLIISVISWLLSAFINEQGRVEYVDYIDLKKKNGDRWE